jgi:hypothetical protein
MFSKRRVFKRKDIPEDVHGVKATTRNASRDYASMHQMCRHGPPGRGPCRLFMGGVSCDAHVFYVGHSSQSSDLVVMRSEDPASSSVVGPEYLMATLQLTRLEILPAASFAQA